MAKDTNLITKEGIAKLKEELKNLINVKRPEIIKQIQNAREQGDLSENADYDAAKNTQAIIEGRIKEIEGILSNTEIIKDSDKVIGKIVSIGKKIKIKDLSDNKIYSYAIVGAVEANPNENKISNECPLAKSILGKKENDEVLVRGIDEPYKVKILEIF